METPAFAIECYEPFAALTAQRRLPEANEKGGPLRQLTNLGLILSIFGATPHAWAQTQPASPPAQTQTGLAPVPPPPAPPATSAQAPPPTARATTVEQLQRECLALGYVAPGQEEAPHEIPYQEGAPAPAGYRLTEQSRKGLWITGLSLGSAFYLMSLTVGLSSDHERDLLLAIPVAGPPLRLAGEEEPGVRGLLAVDTVAQVGSAVLIITGLVYTKQVWVRDYSMAGAEQASIGFVPFVSKESSGVNLVGTF